MCVCVGICELTCREKQEIQIKALLEFHSIETIRFKKKKYHKYVLLFSFDRVNTLIVQILVVVVEKLINITIMMISSCGQN